MRKIIVRIMDDDIKPQEALKHVSKVIDYGRVSNYGTNYCYVMRFDGEVLVWAKKNSFNTDADGNIDSTSDTFVVWKEKE